MRNVGFTLVQSTLRKSWHYWRLRERWKQDTSCKQALYCKWQLQYLKHIMRARLCWQRHFPRINTGKRHSTCRVPSHGKLNAALMSIFREDWKAGSWAPCEISFCQTSAQSPAKPPAVSRAVSSCWAKIQRETWICTKKRQPKFVQIKWWVV